MSVIAILLDENIPASVIDALRAAEPAIAVSHAGHDPGTPPKGTLDPAVLAFAEDNGFALVTLDKRSMPGHVADHLAEGRHTHGVLSSRTAMPCRRGGWRKS